MCYVIKTVLQMSFELRKYLSVRCLRALLEGEHFASKDLRRVQSGVKVSFAG